MSGIGRIVVTGSTGFLGRHLMPILVERYGPEAVTGVSRAQYDLLDSAQVCRMFQELRPDVLVHLAAYSGGIGANKEFPADFYYQNTLLTTLVFHHAARLGLRKLLYPMGGCSYPATAASPIDEGQMWQGLPQLESLGYSSAKKMGIVASLTYRKQYGLNSVVVIPGNMYGEYDNFRMGESHVIPATVRRFSEAKRAGAGRIVMWGSGRPVRDFVYAGDVAKTIPWFVERYDSSDPVNISTGTTTSIRELAETIQEMMQFKGEIVWDTSKPDGQMVKIFDVGRLESLGLSCPTSLQQGIRRTIAWFEQNYESQGAGIRL